MTDEVGALVLRDNYLQNQAISVMERMSVARLGSKQHFVRTLESQGLLDRQLEFLPSDAEFAERKARGTGLTRPELSVLLSYSKIVLFQQLLDSDVPEDPYLSKELVRYFPQALQQRYADEHAAPPPAARDHRHLDHQFHRQPHGLHLRACACRRTPASRPARSPRRIRSRARCSRRARCGPRSRRSTARCTATRRSTRCCGSGT